MAKKLPTPYDFIPANTETRGNWHPGAGTYYGHGVKQKMGPVRPSSTYKPNKDKVSGFKKPITQA